MQYAHMPALAQYLIDHPRSRRTAPVAIVEQRGARRVYECICGGRISCSTDWPTPKCVVRFREKHNSRCGTAYLQPAEGATV